MAKSSALGSNFYIGGVNVSGDVTALNSISSPVGQIVVTDITQSAYSRIGGVRDGSIEFVTMQETGGTGGATHVALKALPTTDTIVSFFVGAAIGNPAASLNAKQVNYDGNRASDGSLFFTTQATANGFGLEWGNQLTAGIRTDTAATAGSPYDNGSSFAFGAQGYLQAFSFSGTDVTVKIQHATSSGGSYSDLITFTQITGSTPLAQRVAVSNATTVNEFLKVTTVTTGGFSSLAFACMVNVNQVAGVVF